MKTKKDELDDLIRPHTLYWCCYNDCPLEYNHTGKVIKICSEFAVSFYLFLAENYHTEDESWSYSKLPKGFVQDRKTYDIIEIKDALKIYLEQKV